MIATGRFVFVHLHKSGGTFVNECLLRFFADARRLGYHLPRSLIPEPYRALPVLGFVRSPWSYYVSWYAFQSRMARPNPLFLAMSRQRTLDFAGTVRNLLDLGSDGALLDDLLPRLPTAYGQSGLNLPGFALAPIRASGAGFYSYLYRYLYGEDDAGLTIGRVEHLREDLLAFLDRFDGAVTPPLREFVLRETPRNPSQHGAWRDYYDDTLAAQVAERDRAVIERFGYRFGD